MDRSQSALPPGATAVFGEALGPRQRAEAAALLREYLSWVIPLESFSVEAPTFRDLAAEREGLPADYSPPAGRFIAVFEGERAAGCVALSRRDAETAELKRLYVRSGARGQGLGTVLVRLALAAAAEAGYQKVVLESHVSMSAAHRIYLAEGFRVVEPPAAYPAYLRAAIVCMERATARGLP